jgi:hypothetical protein
MQTQGADMAKEGDLKQVLKKHAEWLADSAVGERADLHGANLYGADLGGADLGGADLRRADLGGADLHGANLHGANLHGANLGGADLRRANLGGADLGGADLGGADLYGADLRGADLGGANLYGADLRRANLGGADLRGADLGGADLRRANLYGADLRGADLSDAKLPYFQICPEEGEFVGYKKLQNGDEHIIAKLLIPADAKRTSSLIGRKCRASAAIVLEGEGESPTYKNKLFYKVGERIEPDSFDDDIRVECAHGIHFFVTRQEAEEF